jgi:hypothetical protein
MLTADGVSRALMEKLVFWFGWIAFLQGKGFFCFNLRPVTVHVDRRSSFACDRDHFLMSLSTRSTISITHQCSHSVRNRTDFQLTFFSSLGCRLHGGEIASLRLLCVHRGKSSANHFLSRSSCFALFSSCVVHLHCPSEASRGGIPAAYSSI